MSSGFEVQIDNTGVPDGRLKHKTGALYAVNYPNDLVDDTLSAGTDARRFRKALPTRRNFNDRS
jgi:hypothetical protein